MSHLRFSPEEYRAICEASQPLPLGRPRSFKQLLTRSLADAHPDLAARVGGLGRRQVEILHEHLRVLRQGDVLSAAELALLASSCAAMFRHSRFVRPLRLALVQHLLQTRPELAAKVVGLSQEQFEFVCDAIRGHPAAGFGGEDSCRN